MTVSVLIYSALATALVLGAALFALRRQLDRVERIILFVLPAISVVLSGTLITEFLESFFRVFTDGRLAPAASLICGYRLYYPLDEGPILGMMYSPLAAVMYVPAVLAPTPEAAVSNAEVLTMVYYFGPTVAALVVESRRAGVSPGLAALIVVSFGFMTELQRALSGMAFWIHADAPAIGFAGCACFWLQFGRTDARFVSYLGPAVLATAAVLSKQVAVPMLAAIPLCALLFEGRRASMTALLAVVATAVAAAGVVLCAVDVRALLLNAVLLPIFQPWWWSPLEAVARGSLGLVEASAWPVGLIIGSAFFTVRARKIPPDAQRPASSRWFIWLIVAVLMIPSSVLGRIKRGGDMNALGYTVYFLAVAAHLRLIHICARRGEFRPRMPDGARLVPLYLATSLAVWMAPEVIDRLPLAVARFPQNPERVGFEFAKQHPGEVYFPFHPLILLKSEGKAYHFSDGVASRELAGITTSESHIRAFVPESMQMVAFTGPGDHSQKYLPEYSKRVAVDGLKGWNVFKRNITVDMWGHESNPRSDSEDTPD